MAIKSRRLSMFAVILLASVASVWKSADVILPIQSTAAIPWNLQGSMSSITPISSDGIDGNSVDDNPHSSQPRPTFGRPLVTTEHTSSACLIWMDDYHRLVEWIAYHYYTMSLRFLVIFRDPASTQDLTPLLQRWKSRMHIEVWHNATEFASTEQIRQKVVSVYRHFQRTHSNQANLNVHLLNQQQFWRSCSLHMQRHKRRWTFYIDTDEFIILNGKLVPNATHLMTLPGSVLSTIEYIQHHNITNGNALFEKPCINFARIQCGATESPDEDVRRDVPAFLDPYRFQTLRFRHSQAKTFPGKTIADVSRLDFVAPSEMSIHALIKDVCPSPWEYWDSVLHIVQYVGSLELFLRPADRRGMWNRTNKWYIEGQRELTRPGLSIGDTARGWIGGFVDYFGNHTSALLLQDVGQPYNASTAMERKLPPCSSNCIEQYISNGPIALIHKTIQDGRTADEANAIYSSLGEYAEAVAAAWSAVH